jgi:putative tricarboxylic transport membrane protein
MKVRPSHGDTAAGAVLAGLGLWWLSMSWKLGMGSVQEPGPGFFPAAIAVALFLGGLGCVVRALRQHDTAEPVAWMESSAAKAAGLIVFLCVALAALGFVPASLLFLFAMLYFLGDVGMVKSCAMSAAITFVAWLVFERALSVQLPSGFIFS